MSRENAGPWPLLLALLMLAAILAYSIANPPAVDAPPTPTEGTP